MFFASLWDCFLLFCEHKENTGKEKKKEVVGFLEALVKVFLFKTQKLKLLSIGSIWQVHCTNLVSQS